MASAYTSKIDQSLVLNIKQVTEGIKRVDSKDNPNNDHDEFIRWASSRNDLFSQPKITLYSLANQKYFSARVTATAPRSNRVFHVHGRGKSLQTAISKVYGEGIERIAAHEMMEFGNLTTSIAIQKSVEGEPYLINLGKQVYLPLKEFQSSNGWAFHFNLKQAVMASFREALERHILLLNFLKMGWHGFTVAPGGKWNDIECVHLLPKLGVAGVRAGMVAANLNQNPGMTLGYICENSKNFLYSSGWSQAFFEAIEPALYFEQKPESRQIEAGEAEDLFLIYQKRLAESPRPKLEKCTNPNEFINFSKSVTTNLLVADVSELYKAPIPLYLVYSFGEDLIPIFFKERESQNTQILVDSLLSRIGVSGAWPALHPVL